MNRLIDKYAAKIAVQGLARECDITMIGLDADFAANRAEQDIPPELFRVFGLMNISSLLYVEPAEPYRTILRYLSAHAGDAIVPSDCETRTFLHDIPVIAGRDAEEISRALSGRKAAIVNGGGIVSAGAVSPEQAFVSFSSVCFSSFVKFFVDLMFHLEDCAAGKTDRNPAFMEAYQQASHHFSPAFPACADVPAAAPRSPEETVQQIAAAGKALVGRRLVDSYFGNISYILGDTVYISQTGSSLDELEGCIDAVPLEGSSSTGITASSELSAHIGIFRKTGMRAIVHGHPRFTVVMSMACRKDGCDISDCYRTCREERTLCGIPVVSGEIGTGPTGLMHTVPDAMAGNAATVVFGHGVFAADETAFRPALELLQSVEERAMREYFKKIHGLI